MTNNNLQNKRITLAHGAGGRQTAALIHDTKRPEPYGGKGIKYKGEFIIRKEGKRAAAGGKK